MNLGDQRCRRGYGRHTGVVIGGAGSIMELHRRYYGRVMVPCGRCCGRGMGAVPGAITLGDLGAKPLLGAPISPGDGILSTIPTR